MARIFGIVIFFLGVIAFFFLWIGNALAIPPAKSSDECALYADMALVAASASKNKISRPVAQFMMEDIYAPTGDAAEVMRVIMSRVYKTIPGDARAYAKAFQAHCISSKGQISGFLGIEI